MARSNQRTEDVIRAKAEALLRAEGKVPWAPKRSHAIAGETDILGVFDLLVVDPKTGLSEFIQLTTAANHAARRKKVQKWLMEYDVCGIFQAQVWSYHQEKETFRKEVL